MPTFSTYLRRGSLALVAIAVGGFAADFAMNLGLSHLLAPHEYGDYKVAHAFAAFFGVAVLLGGDRAAPKALAGPLRSGETAPVWEYLRFYLWIALGLSVLVIFGAWGACALQTGTLDPRLHHPIALMSAAVPMYAIGALASRGLQSARFPVLASFPWRVVAPILFLLLVGLATWTWRDVNLPELALLSVVTAAAISAWQWWALRRLKMPRLLRDPRWRTPRVWLATSVPMMGVFLVTLALNQSDLYFLELLGDEDQVGHYAAAATCAHFLLLIQTTIVGLVAPLLQPALESGPEAARATRRQGELLMAFALVPAAVLLVLAAHPILALFGPTYPRAEGVLVMLVIANTAWAAAALSALWLQYTNRGPVVVAVALSTLVVDSALNAALIPHYGMQGAAASTAAAMALAAAATLVARRRLQD